MIQIRKSPTADTRTCDWSKVTKLQLLESSYQHIADVREGLFFFSDKLIDAGKVHDFDKITEISWFHRNFQTGFKEQDWLDNHRKINRHHLDNPNGVPDDVNLIDVIEHIVDCVMAGMARSGDIFPLKLSDELLQKAFANTTELLKNNIEIDS